MQHRVGVRGDDVSVLTAILLLTSGNPDPAWLVAHTALPSQHDRRLAFAWIRAAVWQGLRDCTARGRRFGGSPQRWQSRFCVRCTCITASNLCAC